MTITKDEALQKACKHLSSEMKGRLEIVDRISGCLYMRGNIDVNNSWIIYVHSDGYILDGPEQYILIDKNTGVMNEIIT